MEGSAFPRPWVRGALALWCGASLGAGLVVIGERTTLEEGPPGWQAQEAPIPGLAQWVEGEPATAARGWPLDGHQRYTAPSPAHEIGAQADLGEDGVLILALPTHSGGEEVRLQIASGHAPAVVLLRPDDMQRRGNLVACDPMLSAPVSGLVSAQLSHRSESLTIRVNGLETHCGSPSLGEHPLPSIQSGLARIYLSAISLDGTEQRPSSSAWPLLLLGALTGGAGLAWGIRRRPHLVPASLPLLATLPLAMGDIEGWLQGARIHSSHPLLVPLGLPLAATLLLGLALELGAKIRREDQRPLVSQALLSGALGGLVLTVMAAVTEPDQAWATAAFGGVGVALSWVLWANCRAKDLPSFNWISLGGICLAVVFAEVGVRGTNSGRSWAGLASPGMALESEADLTASFSMLESARVHTDYPDQGYPIAPPPRASATRIVALGGSSTGGAFVTDDLNTFFPSRLGAIVGDSVQVLNQGVGGWTTLHIKRYVETRIADLDPDIVIVYVGHNDLLTRSRVPYRDLHQAWTGSQQISSLLGRSWLYRGLRFAVESSAGRRDGVAVPIEHAAENLEALASVFSQANAQLLLVPEVVTPQTPELSRYAGMMKQVASSHDHVAWIDVSDPLRDPANGKVFLDDVHLSERGHQVLAEELHSVLEKLSWVAPLEEPAQVSPSLENDHD